MLTASGGEADAPYEVCETRVGAEAVVDGRGDATTGVYGVSSSGVGVTGVSAWGFAMYANGNAGQARDKGGFIKAMLFVDPFLPADQ